MKKIKQLAKISLLALAISFGSCSSDSDGGSTGGGITGSGTIQATVDGQTITSMQQTTLGMVGGTFLNLQGTTMSGEAIGITLYGYTGAGTYNLMTGNDLGAILFYTKVNLADPTNVNNTWSAPLDGHPGATGTVTVTEATDANVKGTFSFKGYNEAGNAKNVTNGSFNVPLSQQGM